MVEVLAVVVELVAFPSVQVVCEDCGEEPVLVKGELRVCEEEVPERWPENSALKDTAIFVDDLVHAFLPLRALAIFVDNFGFRADPF